MYISDAWVIYYSIRLFAQSIFVYSFQAKSQLLYKPGVYFGGATL